MIAAESLASEIGEDHLEKRQLFPAFSEIRDISAHIGAAVAAKAYDLGTHLFPISKQLPYITGNEFVVVKSYMNSNESKHMQSQHVPHSEDVLSV